MFMFVIAVILVLAGIAAIFWSGIKRVGTAAHCAGCTFELTGIPDADCCPECGRSLVPPAARVVGRRNQNVFRLGLILILISLPFFLLRYSQVKSTSDQHKPLWWLRAEYAFVHQDDWRYFGELRRQLDSATQTTNRERRLAKLVLDQADALGGQPNICDAVISAYRHATPAERSKHIRKIVQQWVDDGLNKQTLGFMYLPTYLQYSTNQIDIEPLVVYLESQWESLNENSTRYEIRQALDYDLIGLLSMWWEANGPAMQADYNRRIRGDVISIGVNSPTVLSNAEQVPLQLWPRFANLVYRPPGWIHTRITEIRIDGERLDLDYPIEYLQLLTNPAGARPVKLDLSVYGSGTFEMEIDAQAIATESGLQREAEWEEAYSTTIRRTLQIMPSEQDEVAYWASEEIRQAAHDAIRVQRLGIISVEHNASVFDVWDLSFAIIDSPVYFWHDVIIKQGDQTWDTNFKISCGVGKSDFFMSHAQFQATVACWVSQSESSAKKVPVAGEPVTIRFVPQSDLPYNLRDKV